MDFSRRPRWVLICFAAGCCILVTAVGWREWDYRSAIREAQAAGGFWKADDPVDKIRMDWKAAFTKRTWITYRHLHVQIKDADLSKWSLLFKRLRLTTLGLAGSTALQNVDGLKGLSNLKGLDLSGCTALQNVDGLKGLSNLEVLELNGCTSLENVDALNSLSKLRFLSLNACTSLQNVDGLKELSNLDYLDLSLCKAIQNVDPLKGLTKLEMFSHYGTAVPDSEIEQLRKTLPNWKRDSAIMGIPVGD